MDALSWAVAAATVSADALALRDLGYENLRYQAASSSITIWYENRRRPGQLAALAEVMATVAPMAPPDTTICLVPLRDDQPILSVRTTAASIIAARSSSTPLSASVAGPEPLPVDAALLRMGSSLAVAEALGSTFNNSDLTLQPAWRFNQTTFSLLARADASIPLSSGLRILARTQVPFWPTLGFDPPVGVLRSSGWMTTDVPAVFQLGFDGPKALIAGEIGYQVLRGLGFLKLRGGFLQDAFPELIAKAEASVPQWDLTLGAGYGTYLLGDWGPFFSLTRTFPRSRVALLVSRTNYGTQFRGTFTIDLGPDPRPAPAPARILPGGVFTTSYYATAYDGGKEISPEPDINDFLDRLTPAYVEAHLDDLPWPSN